MTLTTVWRRRSRFSFCLIIAKINALSARNRTAEAACAHFRDTVGGQCNGGFLDAFEKGVIVAWHSSLLR